MPKIIGSKGKLVIYQIKGINETIKNLVKSGQDIRAGTDLGVVRAGNYIETELKESIAGNRAEERSVDTGNLINSISVKKTGINAVYISPDANAYPKTSTTTEDVARFLEPKRHHFENTKLRNEIKVTEIIKEEVKFSKK